ncbi:MAG: hypothetical protein ACFFE2_14075 [Candidatus Thorarchaeota archaeon]
MKSKKLIPNVPRIFLLVYSLLLLLIPLMFSLFDVDSGRLFKSMFPRWDEVAEFGGQTAVLFTLLLFGGFNGYVTSKVTQSNRYRPTVSTAMLLRNSYVTSMILTVPVIVTSSLFGIGDIILDDLLVLVANGLNVFALLSFTSSVGVLVFLELNGERRKRPIDVLKDESMTIVSKMVIVSLVMILIIRAVQALFVSSTAGWDSLYHNVLITSIIDGLGPIQHPFYSDLQNVYPPLYHYIMASLVIATGLPLDMLVILKELIVFVMIAFAMKNLSKSIGLGKRASLLSIPIVYANLPGGGNRPQSVALLFAIVTLYFLITAQQNRKVIHSWLAGLFCGFLILTHFGLAMAMAIILLVNLIYLLIRKDVFSIGYTINCLGVSALVGSLFMIPTLSIFPLGGLLTTIYLVTAISFVIVGPVIIYAASHFMAVEPKDSKNEELSEIEHVHKTGYGFNSIRVRIAVIVLFTLSIMWGILVGDHGYGIVSYATTGIFAPMGFLSIFVVPFAILAIYEIGAHPNLRTRGAFYSFAAPSFIGLIVYLLNPFLVMIDTELLNVIGFLFSFNVYYLQLAIVGFAINASFYISYVISPYISSIGKLPEARLAFKIFKTRETGVFLLMMSVLLAGTVSCRVGELVEFTTLGPLYELHPNERLIIESISQFTNPSDCVLSDAYTSSFIPTFATRFVYFSMQPTANNFQAFEMGQRTARLKSIIYGAPDDVVRGLRSLNISTIFLWKSYPDYFRNITATNSYIDFTATISILKLTPDVTVVAEMDDYIIVTL